MHLIKNKNGVGIAAVIGIVTFVLALTTTLFGVTVNQATMIKKSAENAEIYEKNAQYLTSAIRIIENDPSILDDALKISALSSLLEITIEQPLGQNYWILQNNDIVMPLTSYIQYIPPGSGGDFLFNEFLSDVLTPAVNENDYSIPQDFNIMAASAFYNEFVVANSGSNPLAVSFNDITFDAGNNNRTNVIFYDGARNSSQLSPSSNQILVIKGLYTINTSFNGIVIVDGSVSISVNNLSINGAIFASGDILNPGKGTTYGSIKPTFFYADEITTGGGSSSASNLYTFSNSLSIPNNQLFSGGFFAYTEVYAKPSIQYKPITINPQFYLASGIPSNLYIQFTGLEGGGGAIGEGQLLSTYPRKE